MSEYLIGGTRRFAVARGKPLVLFDQISKHCWWRGDASPASPMVGQNGSGQNGTDKFNWLPEIYVLFTKAISSSIFLGEDIGKPADSFIIVFSKYKES